jgi:hypothetical protein
MAGTGDGGTAWLNYKQAIFDYCGKYNGLEHLENKDDAVLRGYFIVRTPGYFSSSAMSVYVIGRDGYANTELLYFFPPYPLYTELFTVAPYIRWA